MKLDASTVAAHLVSLPSWSYRSERGGVLTRRFDFDDFVGAFGFMSQVALHAERMAHHPEWTNVYGRVDVALTTHDVDGISLKDIEMAVLMDGIAAAIGAKAS